MTGKTPQQVLLDAADMLERDGWCQNRPRLGTRRCALIAVIDATGPVVAGLSRLRLHLGTHFIGDWNDAPGRTAAEVIAALRRAAA